MFVCECPIRDGVALDVLFMRLYKVTKLSRYVALGVNSRLLSC